MAMSERPIIFSAPMVRALLDGRKQQTRRICKLAEMHALLFVVNCGNGTWGDEEGVIKAFSCPYGQPGDRLWVRETWGYNPDHPGRIGSICYRADPGHQHDGISWKPSIHMRREASRITLEVAGVRVEMPQDISEADAKAEGVCELPGQAAERGCWWSGDVGAGAALHGRTPSVGYRLLWEQINGARSWDANPWVWVIEFKRITP